MDERVNDGTSEPFFLVGAERSGTTLLRLMLSHHPKIECAPEFEFLVEKMTPEEGYPPLYEYHEWLSTNRIFLPHRLSIDPRLEYPALARSFLDQYCARSRKPIRGATCHKHFDRLPRLWPHARFVHLLRDGRDVARSCIRMGWAGNPWHAAERWLEAERLWDVLGRRVPAERRIEVRYEELIREPEAQLERLCRFLGTEFHPGMLDYDRDSSYGKPDPALINQWRRKLGSRELALLEARMGARLRERGYTESGVPPARVGPLRRLGLAVQNRVFKARFRIGRHGLGHVVVSKLVRGLGLRSLQRRLLIRENATDNRHIR